VCRNLCSKVSGATACWEKFFYWHPNIPLRVLVVDDERLITDTVCAILNQNGFDASPAYSGSEALESARHSRPDIVLSDVLMPKMSGVELGIALREEFPEVRLFLFSGQAATSEMIHRAEADGYRFELFPKPIHPEDLIARLRRAFAS
jgi:DNA-binding response OmpR family regulator